MNKQTNITLQASLTTNIIWGEKKEDDNFKSEEWNYSFIVFPFLIRIAVTHRSPLQAQTLAKCINRIK
jgi:hypothetical protein